MLLPSFWVGHPKTCSPWCTTMLMHGRSASYIQNIEPMRWTAYLEDCLLQLQESNQYSTDPLLVIYVRMQCMAEKVDSNSWFDDTEQLPGWKFYPPILHIRALKAQLQILGKDLETEFPQDGKSLNVGPVCSHTDLIYNSETLFALLQCRDDSLRNRAFKDPTSEHS